MFPSRYLCLTFVLVCGQFAAAQTVVNSTYLEHLGQCEGRYSDPDCWSPPEVPNNNPGRQYNVSVPGRDDFYVDVSATVSNLDLAGFAYLQHVTFTVTGTTLLAVDPSYYVVLKTTTPGLSSLFNAGTLSTYSANTLRGRYSIQDDGGPATMQFNGADITTLSDGFLGLYGPLAKVTDEFGNDALRNFRRIESNAELDLSGYTRTVSSPFTNEGTIRLSDYSGFADSPTVFTATHSLTNFDPADRTLRGGKFIINFGFAQPGPLVELRFNGADIVNNGSDIELTGPGSKITDLIGNDGLRNLAHNLPGAALRFSRRDFATLGAFRNDGLLSLTLSTFTVAGPLVNFDAATGTLISGTYELYEANFKFSGADIVHNGASLTLFAAVKVTDLAGNDALRGFRDNLSSGSFTLGQDFTAPGNFTNAGHVGTNAPFYGTEGKGRFIVPAGFSYTQTTGTTLIDGELIADNVNIFGGSLSGAGLIKGNLTVTNAMVSPLDGATLDGNLTLNSGSHFIYNIDLFNQVGTWRHISGKAAVAGTLDVVLDPAHTVSSEAVIVLLQSQGPITGSFSNAPHGTRIATVDGKGSFVVIYEPNTIKLTQFRASPPPAQLLNISSRAFLSRADNDPYGNRAVLIGGFIISGSESKKVVVRGLGPSLGKFGLSPTLADPTLELHSSDGATIATNDDWADANESEITAFGLAPDEPREAALIATLDPGMYTVVIREKNGLGGHGLVEVYDVAASSTSKLGNISTRGFTDSASVLIGGIIAGGGQANAEIVVRAIGPQMRGVGILNALEDPTLELRDQNGAIVAFNDDWIVNYEDFLPIYELAPEFNEESGMRLSLPGGNYTAIVRAKGESGGLALVEFYDLRR